MARFNLLSDPQLPRPVTQLLCGSFAGPGSHAMAAVSVHGVCLPFLGWGVFRFSAGSWQLVPGGSHPGGSLISISNAGNDIVERAAFYHPGEGICFPSGVHSRTWHWNGSRLVAGRWQVISNGPTLTHYDNFRSPDRKVWCRIIKATNDAWCGSEDVKHMATLKRDGTLIICNSRPGQDVCLNNYDGSSPLLRVDQTNELNGYRCTALTNAITCVLISSGTGFKMTGAGVTRVP